MIAYGETHIEGDPPFLTEVIVASVRIHAAWTIFSDDLNLYMLLIEKEILFFGYDLVKECHILRLFGGKNPQVLGAGIVEIRGGKIYSVDNASSHFKPGTGSLEAAKDAFGKIPDNYFSKDFKGYKPYGEN
ncbi:MULTISPECIES: hypothetical protein [unclassified Serratia (in: enterobacteria)]|uniref:hypothetical protein n=1 Tax=unclassified Serratia (in: enterobacteria) TaxID=2647522 RepID=UPI000500D581|nr:MULTISPECIES: hypothetical protein [unclassified Serratia (in: enterobacteria)]KFK92338.1 hypothetical protein JV45_21730 [Serratia sp. Ag2]KFK98819.1 hypothetical protein IV04_11660 [Serratia sp. Ag1]